VVPEAAIPKVGARIKDLQEPTRKMSKSEASAAGLILLLEDLKSVEKKIKRAVTDTETEVRYDPMAKPGVSNLLELLGAATGEAPADLAAGYTQYGPLKTDTAAAVVELLRPIQARYADLAADPAGTAEILAKGAAKAEATAADTLARAQRNIGLLPRS
jgi:tryptophanyl-tRNA synthetase